MGVPLLPGGIKHGDLLGSGNERLARRFLRENLKVLEKKPHRFGFRLSSSISILVLSARLGCLTPEIITRLEPEDVSEKLDASARLVKELLYEDEL